MAVTDEIKSVEVDVSKLTALSPEVISKQATINIGKKKKNLKEKKKKRLITIYTCISTYRINLMLYVFFFRFIRYHWSRSSR